MFKRCLWFSMVYSVLATPVWADATVRITGAILEKVPTQSSGLSVRKSGTPPMKTIALLRLQLNEQARKGIQHRAQALQTPQESSEDSSSPLPRVVRLGMNGVPVLDQGAHGTCVTFASTAALDAIIGQGDYVSQLCPLALGQYLENQSYLPSGWDGSWAPYVLQRLIEFGVVSHESEKTTGCGGYYTYPTGMVETLPSLNNIDEYHAMSQPADQWMEWTTLLSPIEALNDQVNTVQVLRKVKASLAAGDRVTYGVILQDFDAGVGGAIGSHRVNNDTWVLTPQILRDTIFRPDYSAGHEMVITGYNDNAVAVDSEGHKHKGLLIVRNSWGDNIGNHGNFYMSYDYFQLLVLEAHRIRAEVTSHLPDEEASA
ncbi:MAG: C1 family peptidase [Legionellaceae bacterium]|nr:C1 family peptidase [Legionellaceae bacterium]